MLPAPLAHAAEFGLHLPGALLRWWVAPWPAVPATRDEALQTAVAVGGALLVLYAAWAHVATLARSVGNAQLRSTAILTGWTANPYSKRDVRWFVPDDLSLVDVLAFDNYNGTPQATVNLDKAAAASIGKPFGVAEFGVQVVNGDTIGRADFIRSFATTAAGAGATVWETTSATTTPHSTRTANVNARTRAPPSGMVADRASILRPARADRAAPPPGLPGRAAILTPRVPVRPARGRPRPSSQW